MNPMKLAAQAVMVSLLAGFTSVAAGEAAWIGSANNAFALDLYARLAATAQGNLFFSPISIEAALAMTDAGARGRTAEQMTRVLHLPQGDDVHRDLGAFLKELTAEKTAAGAPRSYQLSVANALWGQSGYEFQPAFLRLLDHDYGARLHEVDYLHDTEGARRDINNWVGKETHDKICELIQPGALSALTRLVLGNAIYFKGTWTTAFDQKLTQDAPFYLSRDRQATVPMMNRTGEYGYAETEDVQALKLPYVGGELSMVILLPTRIDGLAEMEKSLTAEPLARWLSALHEQKVVVLIPRYKLETGFELSKTLEEMGMTDAFSGAADFSGMSSRKDLFISHVIHKAFVEVNEEGTEAAAATGVVMRPMMVRRNQPPIFRADHPFVFLIRQEQSGAILFLGRLSHPESK